MQFRTILYYSLRSFIILIVGSSSRKFVTRAGMSIHQTMDLGWENTFIKTLYVSVCTESGNRLVDMVTYLLGLYLRMWMLHGTMTSFDRIWATWGCLFGMNVKIWFFKIFECEIWAAFCALWTKSITRSSLWFWETALHYILLVFKSENAQWKILEVHLKKL